MNWYIGQRIVAIKDHSQGLVKKGDTKVIGDISSCSCGKITLDVGLRSKQKFQCGHCRCGAKYYQSSGILWMAETLFAPLDTHPELSELTDEMILTATEVEELQTA